jgi:hypothetical protein
VGRLHHEQRRFGVTNVPAICSEASPSSIRHRHTSIRNCSRLRREQLLASVARYLSTSLATSLPLYLSRSGRADNMHSRGA